MGMIEDVERAHLRTDIPDFKAGDTVRVNVKIKEGEKERIQAFEGGGAQEAWGLYQGILYGEKNVVRCWC